jgi:hypothetical protein
VAFVTIGWTIKLVSFFFFKRCQKLKKNILVAQNTRTI